ncbi:MAG TPA: ATP-binding cassette domain-containing protein [Fibrobacteria bacterium]|nr:ATP-binding cassette domain-containing protein [Fibrobacteria bacterium]
MSEILSEACGLRFGYREEEALVDGVDFQVRRGDVRIISGESGKGKSTILRCLVGLEQPMLDDLGSAAGQVFLFGEDIWDIPHWRLQELRKRTGYVFQNNALISNMSVEDNIAVPLRYHTDLPEEEIHRKVQKWIDMLLLNGHEDKRPAHLSLGMQKRAAVARAMAMEPEILFLDEPTAGLDAKNTDIMLSLIGNLRALSNVAIVMVTHDLASAKPLGGRIALLLDGHLRRARTMEELLMSPDLYERDLVRETDERSAHFDHASDFPA